MQASQPRCLILIALLVASAVLLAAFDRPGEERVARWPDEDAVYAVDGWTMGPLVVEHAYGVAIVSRDYARADGATATLAISTSPEAKRIYRVGAEVPFLGNGYTVDPAPPSLVPPEDHRRALLVRREAAHGLLLFGYGERRGLVGNGAAGWSLVVLDAVLGRSNDYYLARLLTPLDRSGARELSATLGLADALFQRLGTWYGR